MHLDSWEVPSECGNDDGLNEGEMEDGVKVDFPEPVVPPVVEMVVPTYALWREQGPWPVKRKL